MHDGSVPIILQRTDETPKTSRRMPCALEIVTDTDHSSGSHGTSCQPSTVQCRVLRVCCLVRAGHCSIQWVVRFRFRAL